MYCIFAAFLSVTYYIHRDSLTTHTRVPSPVVPVPGVGQVGQGLQSTWGLEEDDGEEGNDNCGEEQEETVTKMEEEEHEKDTGRGGYYFFSIVILSKS